jgi:DNA-binding NarL/FixJ family response regulator
MKNPETTTHVIKVAIADDHTLFRSGVKASLTAHKDIHMVAEARMACRCLIY